MKFSQFMASGLGRVLRVVAGIALIYYGLFVLKNMTGYAIGAIGVAPLLAGVFDVCVFAPLFKMPLAGGAIRAYKKP